MFKIHKYISLTRRLPVASNVRYMSCSDKCPPRYECKQPEPDEMEKTIEELRELQTPNIFSTPCGGHAKFWRNLFCYLCIPAVLCVFINIFFVGGEEFRRPRFVEFTYLRIRNKEYVWDPVRTLFHNPRLNALPDGYEVEVPEEQEYDPFERFK